MKAWAGSMKVLHINSYYSVSPFYKNLFEEQVKRGINIDVYVPVAKNYIIPPREFGSYTKISLNHGRYDRYIFHIKHLKILRDVIKNYDISEFNILHAHSLFSNGYIAYKLNQKYRVPYIVAVRDTDVNTFFKRLLHLRKLGIEILRHANKVIFLSTKYKEFTIKTYIPKALRKEISDKSVIIPNGIDAFWLNNKPTEVHRLKSDEVNILFVGRISRRKNVSTTIKACQMLIDRGYKVRFTVVGCVEDDREYNIIKQNNFVTYINHQPKEKLIDIYRSNDIFVMPSITETFGLVYAEAMSQGLPVIYTKGQGFDGQFEEGLVGYHVDCYDPNEIANRIVDIINNYGKLSENCLRLCDKFDWSLIAKQYDDVYKELLHI